MQQWLEWFPVREKSAVHNQLRLDGERGYRRDRAAVRDTSHLSKSTSQYPKTREELLIIKRTSSQTDFGLRANFAPKLQHVQRGPTPRMCHMRRTRETESSAQTLPTETSVTLNEARTQLSAWFLLLWHFPPFSWPVTWDCWDSAACLFYVQPRRRVVFQGGPF